MPDLEQEQEGQRQLLVEIFESIGAPPQASAFSGSNPGNRAPGTALLGGKAAGGSNLQSLACKLNQMSM